jgi:predicted small metal-binding protein
MYQFKCGSPVCKARFTAPTEDALMGQVAKHVAEHHRVPNPSKSLVQFLKDNTISEVKS